MPNCVKWNVGKSIFRINDIDHNSFDLKGSSQYPSALKGEQMWSKEKNKQQKGKSATEPSLQISLHEMSNYL